MAAQSSFIPVSRDSHFPLQNLPFGIFRPIRGSGARPRVGTAIGDFVVDLSALACRGAFSNCPHLCKGASEGCFAQSSLNAFIALGRDAWREARECLTSLLAEKDPYGAPSASCSSVSSSSLSLQYDDEIRGEAVIPISDVVMEMPVNVGDFTDFYSSRHHASNIAAIFRGGNNTLPANWVHLPTAYHGRASSIVVSGTPIHRPWGQVVSQQSSCSGLDSGPGVHHKHLQQCSPDLKPCEHLDFELEVAAVVGVGTTLGTRVSVEHARDHIFGFVLLNDWSARDIQKWESVPLGPLVGKNFGTSISPWVVTQDALEPFTCPAPVQDPPPLPYLRNPRRRSFDIRLEAAIRPPGATSGATVCRTNYRHLYWTVDQQMSHLTVGGCSLRPGDLLASGTVSGPETSSLACLLELSGGGTRDVVLNLGAEQSQPSDYESGYQEKPKGQVTRRFLEDGDEVVLSGYCDGGSYRVGFGTCVGHVLPAIPLDC